MAKRKMNGNVIDRVLRAWPLSEVALFNKDRMTGLKAKAYSAISIKQQSLRR